MTKNNHIKLILKSWEDLLAELKKWPTTDVSIDYSNSSIIGRGKNKRRKSGEKERKKTKKQKTKDSGRRGSRMNRILNILRLHQNHSFLYIQIHILFMSWRTPNCYYIIHFKSNYTSVSECGPHPKTKKRISVRYPKKYEILICLSKAGPVRFISFLLPARCSPTN